MSDYNDGLLPEPCLRLDFGFGQQYASIELGDGSGYVRVAENAKLRELVKEAHLCMVNEGSCEDCYVTHGECPIERDMRELGIEVPD